MALNIKDLEVERLASEVAKLTHESKTEAIKRALVERRARLLATGAKPRGHKSLRDYLEQDVWPFIPTSALGRTMTREDEDHILGYGEFGNQLRNCRTDITPA
ncbi:MAG TPA: type II toxin-antitoxin system VapB family antitoxin [Bryobacteraceae bacterium]